jgi:hypothetical protein
MMKTLFLCIIDSVRAHDFLIFVEMKCIWQHRLEFHPKVHSCLHILDY